MTIAAATDSQALVGSDGTEPARPDSLLFRVGQAIDRASHFLPAQGPIKVFIHHNTLHVFEDLPFHEGVQKGARIFGCQPYLSEDHYHEMLGRGRIRVEDLSAVLLDDLGEHADDLLGFM